MSNGFVIYKCTKHQFIHLLTATFKDLHIENSKNYKRWYCPHHTDCVSVCCWLISARFLRIGQIGQCCKKPFKKLKWHVFMDQGVVLVQ